GYTFDTLDLVVALRHCKAVLLCLSLGAASGDYRLGGKIPPQANDKLALLVRSQLAAEKFHLGAWLHQTAQHRALLPSSLKLQRLQRQAQQQKNGACFDCTGNRIRNHITFLIAEIKKRQTSCRFL